MGKDIVYFNHGTLALQSTLIRYIYVCQYTLSVDTAWESVSHFRYILQRKYLENNKWWHGGNEIVSYYLIPLFMPTGRSYSME